MGVLTFLVKFRTSMTRNVSKTRTRDPVVCIRLRKNTIKCKIKKSTMRTLVPWETKIFVKVKPQTKPRATNKYKYVWHAMTHKMTILCVMDPQYKISLLDPVALCVPLQLLDQSVGKLLMVTDLRYHW